MLNLVILGVSTALLVFFAVGTARVMRLTRREQEEKQEPIAPHPRTAV